MRHERWADLSRPAREASESQPPPCVHMSCRPFPETLGICQALGPAIRPKGPRPTAHCTGAQMNDSHSPWGDIYHGGGAQYGPRSRPATNDNRRQRLFLPPCVASRGTLARLTDLPILGPPDYIGTAVLANQRLGRPELDRFQHASRRCTFRDSYSSIHQQSFGRHSLHCSQFPLPSLRL